MYEMKLRTRNYHSTIYNIFVTRQHVNIRVITDLWPQLQFRKPIKARKRLITPKLTG